MDIYSSNWDESDASNSDAAPDGAPEGMASSGVNDTMRAMMGATKRFVNQQSPLVTAGSATAFTLAYSVAPGALVDAMTHLVQFNAANGNAPTLNVNSLGATPLHYYSAGAWRAVPAALWGADEVFRVAYNSSAGAYRLVGFRNRTGEVIPFAGTTAPAGSLLCYGQAISRTAYVGLFTALSTTYGVGDGSNTFNLPDLRGRVAAGKDDMGGSGANRIQNAISGFNGTALGAAGGSEQKNTQGPGSTTPVRNDATNVNVGTSDHTHLVNGVQPTIILNYVVRI